jgi:hypothetical protein
MSMVHSRRFLFRMGAFLAAVLLAIIALHNGLSHAFLNNLPLNSLILGILLFGIVLNFRQVILLEFDASWLSDRREGRDPPTLSGRGPRLLAPLARMLEDRGDRLALSPAALRSVLDSVSSRVEESRDIAHYFTGLMIFLGLLGTFWGLSQTVGSIGDVIRTLSISGDDIQSAFSALKQGLDAPLAGMGTAFSTSLIGLSGSLILGFLDLQASQAQNLFLNDLEDWLAGKTRMSAGVGMSSGEASDQPVPVYIQALLEQTADSLDNLQRVMARGEESRIAANQNMRQLTDKLATLADQMKTEQALMLKLAEHQIEMKPILAKLAEARSSTALDDASRNHLRNMDGSLSRLVEELSQGRDELIREIRGEFKMLARTLASRTEEDAAQQSQPFRLGRPEP